MLATVWLSVKENMNCVGKLTDVCDRKRKYSTINGSLDSLFVSRTGQSSAKVLFRRKNPGVRFHELSIDDPSKKIVEMIFQKASMDPTKSMPKVERVLRVINSPEVLEIFERHRQIVMQRADQQHDQNPRSSVDGNEMLPFYSTTVTCCNGKSKKVNEVCSIPTCSLCRIIQSKFDTESTRKTGVVMRLRSDFVFDNRIRFSRGKKAVVLCRIIAGKVANTLSGFYDDWDSIGRGEHDFDLDYLIVKDPRAILPCFVIVFS